MNPVTTQEYQNGPDHDIYVFDSIGDVLKSADSMRLERLILVVCGRGEITATVDVTPRRMTAHSVMVLRPGHFVEGCRTSDDFKGFFITVTEERISRLFPSMQYMVPYTLLFYGDPIIEITPAEYDSLSLMYDLFRTQLGNLSRPFGTMAIDTLCELLFYNTLGIYALRAHGVEHKSRREELLQQFVELLEKNFKSERSVNFYADHLFVTPKHLSAVLKEVSGQTAGEWICSRVILEAKLMLRNTGMNVQEIAAALNFSNQSFFGKYFKHITGISPREYRTRLSEL